MLKELEGGKIAILAGGPSCEREISLLSGQAVYDALSSLGLDVSLVDPGTEGSSDWLEKLEKEDFTLVFIALHGTFGEDGTVQQLLEARGIPYTGSDHKASRQAFDKAQSKELFRQANIGTPASLLLKSLPLDFEHLKLPLPIVVKPTKSGSSVGVSLVSNKNDYKSAVFNAFEYSDEVLVESYIEGRELTVGILGDEILPIIEIAPDRVFFDYEAKYKDKKTHFNLPAFLTHSESRIVTQSALAAYQALGCQVLGRVDMIVDTSGKVFVLEVNTIPGLTNKSLLPKAAREQGLDFPQLCVRILELSLMRKGCASETGT